MPLSFSRRTSTSDLPAFLTEVELAAYLSMDVKKLRRLRYEKRGPVYRKIGTEYRVRREDVIAWLGE
jgi:excisionase family DNA binding protein